MKTLKSISPEQTGSTASASPIRTNHFEFEREDPVLRDDQHVRVDADVAGALQPQLERDLPVEAAPPEHVGEIAEQADQPRKTAAR